MTEAELERDACHAGGLFGWQSWHPYDMRRSVPGWPDVTFWNVRGPGFFIVEFKSQHGLLKPEQHSTIIELRTAGVEVHVWYPRHWLDGTIERRFRGHEVQHEELAAPGRRDLVGGRGGQRPAAHPVGSPRVRG